MVDKYENRWTNFYEGGQIFTKVDKIVIKVDKC